MRLGDRWRGAVAGWRGQETTAGAAVTAALAGGSEEYGPTAQERRAMRDGTLGWSLPGGSVFSQMFSEDYHPGLRGVAALRTFDEMRRSDGQVRAIHTVVGLPVRATTWYVEPPMGASAAEKECAELVQRNLIGGMETSFDDLLRELMRAVYMGFTLPEMEWTEREGMSWVKAVHSRNPALVESWLYDPKGCVAGVLYAGNRITGSGAMDQAATTTYERVAIPMYRLLYGVWEGENGSPWGFGYARSLYTHWLYKRTFYKLAGISLERTAVGVPIAKAGPEASWLDRSVITPMLRRIRAGENTGITLPHGWDLDWFEAGNKLADILPLIAHQDNMMARAALAQVLTLGQGTGGTQALASEFVKLFLTAEEAICNWVGHNLDLQFAKRFASLNYGAGVRPPTIRHRDVRHSNVEGLARALTMLVNGELVIPTAADESHVRAVAGLPELPREQLETARAARGDSARSPKSPPVVVDPGSDEDGDEETDD